MLKYKKRMEIKLDETLLVEDIAHKCMIIVPSIGSRRLVATYESAVSANLKTFSQIQKGRLLLALDDNSSLRLSITLFRIFNERTDIIHHFGTTYFSTSLNIFFQFILHDEIDF